MGTSWAGDATVASVRDDDVAASVAVRAEAPRRVRRASMVFQMMVVVVVDMNKKNK